VNKHFRYSGVVDDEEEEEKKAIQELMKKNK
jgi:hypothetical protein